MWVKVDLSDDEKYPIAGVDTIIFQLELGNSLDFDNALFVPHLEKNCLSVLVMKDKGIAVEFKNQQFLIKMKESSSNTARIISVRECNLYRL
jgi:hypothetical protein